MTYLHYLYPLPPLERLSTPSRSLDLSKDLRRSLCEQRLQPQIAWWKLRLWPVPGRLGVNAPTKAEQHAEWEIRRQEYERVNEEELAAARQRCKTMTILEAWKVIRSYLCTNEYEVEAMTDADVEIYDHAKQLEDNHIKRTAS